MAAATVVLAVMEFTPVKVFSPVTLRRTVLSGVNRLKLIAFEITPEKIAKQAALEEASK